MEDELRACEGEGRAKGGPAEGEEADDGDGGGVGGEGGAPDTMGSTHFCFVVCQRWATCVCWRPSSGAEKGIGLRDTCGSLKQVGNVSMR